MVTSLDRAGARARRGSTLAELRDVPGGVRAGRADRRRAGAARCGGGFLVLGSRWWQLESLYRANAKYQPTGTPALPLLRGRPGPAADRHRLGRSPRASSARRAWARCNAAAWHSRLTATRRAPRRRRSVRQRPPVAELDPVAAQLAAAPRAAAGAGRGCGTPSTTRMRAAGVDPYPVGFAAHRQPRRGARAVRRPAADAATGERVVGHRPRRPLARPRRRSASPRCATAIRRPAGDAGRDRLGRRRAARVEARTSTSATTSASTARSSRPGAASCPCWPTGWAITAKCLRPLPDKHQGLSDPEARVRQRYVDLIVNPDGARMLQIRSDGGPGRARLLPGAATSRSRRRCCSRCTAARTPGRSSRTSTPTTCGCTCASRPSCTSSGCWSAVSRRSSRSTATSATRAPTPRTTPSSRCSRRTRPTATTTRCRC